MSDVHGRIEPLIAAYALGAVPADEMPAIRGHIMSCEACFEEAETHTDTLATLATSVAPLKLPRGFAQKVFVDVRPSPAPARTRTAPAGRFWRLVAPIVAACAAVSLLGTAIALVASVDRQSKYERVVASLVRDRRALTLQGPGGAEGILASGDGGTALLVMVDLGEAPPGHDYQLWLMRDGVPTPGVTFDIDRSLVVLETDQDLTGYRGAAITVEPDGGSPRPTTDPVLSSSYT